MEHQRVGWFKRILVLGVFTCIAFFTSFPSECLAVKPESLTIAIIGDMTGPYAPVIGPFGPGTEDAVRYVNEELGGIDGVKLKLVSRDNTGKVALGLQQYAELVEMKPKPLFLGLMHSPLAEALREKIFADGVIGLSTTAVGTIYPRGTMYGCYALYPELAGIAVKWLKDNWKEKQNPRVAIITWDQAYGRAILTEEFLDYCKKIGVDIIATELFGMKDVDLTTHMVRIRAKKPDWLLTNTLGSGPVAIMKAVKELNWDIKLLNGPGGDWGTIRLNPDIFEGCVTVVNQVSYDDTSHSGMKRLLGYMKKNNRGVNEQTICYGFGWQFTLIMHKVVKDAVAKVGWDKLNISTIQYQMNRLTDFQVLDGVYRMTYTDKVYTTPWAAAHKIQGGKMININPGGGFIKAPDLRPAQYR